MKTSRIYILEYNRCLGDNIRRSMTRFNRRGIPADLVPHKTTLRFKRPANMDWPTFTQEIRRELTPRIGSVIVHSQRTGNTFLCRNKGNRAGRFERV